MAKDLQGEHIEERTKMKERGSFFAEEVNGKQLTQSRKMKEKKKVEEEQQQERRCKAPLDVEEDLEGNRKLKGKRQLKQKHKVKKNGKEEEQEEEGAEKTEDRFGHGEEDVQKGKFKGKQKQKGEKAGDEEASKMVKQKQMKCTSTTRSMFADGFEERHDLEQYFWSKRTVQQLVHALQPTAWHSEHGHVCCLTAPSLAHAFYATQGRAEALLDIDKRFDYLPGFRFFDLCNPTASSESDDFRIVVFDPPFFYIPLPVLLQAVLVAVHGNLEAKLLVGFLRREEGAFLQTFAPFHLRRTRFVLEYATVKSNKWCNYALYANIDLPGIKRIS